MITSKDNQLVKYVKSDVSIFSNLNNFFIISFIVSFEVGLFVANSITFPILATLFSPSDAAWKN